MAVIESSWFSVAFDGFYCANVHYCDNINKLNELKPCESFAKLSRYHPDAACKLMDKFITKSDDKISSPENEASIQDVEMPLIQNSSENHNYILFEYIYYNRDCKYTHRTVLL